MAPVWRQAMKREDSDTACETSQRCAYITTAKPFPSKWEDGWLWAASTRRVSTRRERSTPVVHIVQLWAQQVGSSGRMQASTDVFVHIKQLRRLRDQCARSCSVCTWDNNNPVHDLVPLQALKYWVYLDTPPTWAATSIASTREEDAHAQQEHFSVVHAIRASQPQQHKHRFATQEPVHSFGLK
eukprot:scaffold1054_cov366-Prasinococcus_capsulatus_cf.AAC.7